MLKLENISYSIGNRRIIKEINLSLNPGEIIAVMGPNGSGKTTLLKLISGLIPLTSGSILIDHKESHLYSRKEKSRLISLMPQSPQVTFEFTAEDIVLMGAYTQGKISKNLLDEVMKRLSIFHLKDRPFPYLSAGERQRCYFARSLIANTQVMLLDEPSSNQDVLGKEILHQELNTLSKKGKGIILATHDQHAASKCATRIIYLNGASL